MPSEVREGIDRRLKLVIAGRFHGIGERGVADLLVLRHELALQPSRAASGLGLSRRLCGREQCQLSLEALCSPVSELRFHPEEKVGSY